MKTLHFASILVLSAATVFACNDDEDREGLSNIAGTTSEAGVPSGAGNGADNEGGTSSVAASGAAGADVGGSGSAGEQNEAGEGGLGAGAGAAVGGEAGEAGAGGGADPFELIGAYDDNYGGSFVVTADAWAASAIAAYDNVQNAVYTQFPAADPYNPNKFAKTVYTEPTGGSFYFCMVVFSADTLAAAQASTATADDNNPETGGCGGLFPWTKATKK